MGMLTLRLENPAAPWLFRGHLVTNCGLKEADKGIQSVVYRNAFPLSALMGQVDLIA